MSYIIIVLLLCPLFLEPQSLRFSVILLGNMNELRQYFGTFGLALWSHFVIVTMETWPDVADAVLEVASPLWGVYFVVPGLEFK
jgi:glucan phosphoethanolaminetransferase (alkaline phosphatase superfamily)